MTSTKELYLTCFYLLLGFTIRAQTVTDIDGNVYSTVTIGSQTWMAENLRTSRFSNGDTIGTQLGATHNDSNAIYQWAYNDDQSLVPAYGRLYSWYAAVDNRNICPAGWHVPGIEEWDALITFLGGDSTAGNLLKESGTVHWKSTDSSVTNSSGFNTRGNGFRANPQMYSGLREIAFFWTSTPFGTGGFARGYHIRLSHASSLVETGVAVGNCGSCIRCIENKTTNVNPVFGPGKIDIYPTPTDGTLYIDFPSPESGTVSIFDLSGREVYWKRFDEQSFLELDSRQSTGVYLLMIHTAEGIIQKRLVIL
ncbi:MAG TPA: hypothetical protein DIU20_02740 [Cryomorphaceae bacterium]|nr:hypothetical protein [Cryomorphaceae bacterium]